MYRFGQLLWYCILLTFFVLFVRTGFAQETDSIPAEGFSISGTVVDQAGPMPGAALVIKGTKNGTQSDYDGNFYLNRVNPGDTLVISYIGYFTVEHVIYEPSHLNIEMKEDKDALEEVVIIGYGTTKTKPDDAPQFPWPPPLPSTKISIPERSFEDCKTLGEVDDRLVKSLEVNGYDQLSYFLVPARKKNGFALVTQCEQTDSDAFSLQDPERWAAEVYVEDGNFFDWIKASLFPNPGYFRIIVFIVTDRAFTTSKKRVHRKTAMDWLDAGADGFPSQLKDVPFTEEHRAIALVYDYKLDENQENAKLMKPSKFTAKNHLTKARIWGELMDWR